MRFVYAGASSERVELGVAAGPEHVEHPRQHALFGHHRMHLSLQARAQRDQLGPIAHQLAQLPRRRRRDPRLRQATQTQQISQVPGVALVVLDPPVAPVVARRMRQVHPMAIGLEQIHRPIPAVGRLDHHLGVPAGVGNRQRQRDRIVGDPHTRHPLALARHRVDHRAAAMQVDADVTSFHRGLPCRGQTV